MRNRNIFLLMLALLLSANNAALAETYKLVVQPILPMHDMSRQFDPIVNYLSEQTGHKFMLQKSRNFMSYWNKMKNIESVRGFDLVLDAAHFTDYRIQRHGYQVLAKIPETVSFSVVTKADDFIIDMEELVGRKIATMPSPGLGTIRLEAMFPDENSRPEYVLVSDSIDAIEKLMDGRVFAAIIPTPMVGQYRNLNTVITTEPVPHMAFSASPELPADVVDKIKNALLNANKTDAGRAMLKQMNYVRLEPATAAMYKGYMELLKSAPGY